MSIKSRKLFAILVIAMMIMTLLPMTAFAASDNSVDRVPSVAGDYNFTTATAVKLRIAEKNLGDFSQTAGNPEIFRLTLSNAKWNRETGKCLTEGSIVPTAATVTKVAILTDYTAEITFHSTSATEKSILIIPLICKLAGDGEATVTVEQRDSSVSTGTYTFANASAGKTIASIDKVNSFARTVTLAAIQIDETMINALGEGEQKVRLKLPPKFTWENGGNVTFSGGLTGSTITGPAIDKRDLTFSFTPPTDRKSRGSIFINNAVVRADRDAPYGDVTVDIDALVGKVTAAELVVAKYMAYGVEASVKEVKEITAGRYKSATAKITISENIPGSLIKDRELVVELPEWVKVHSFKSTGGSSDIKTEDIKLPSGKQNEFYIDIKNINAGVKSKYEFELELSVEADKSGDIVATFSGAGMESQELVIAKAVSPITAEVAATDVKIGVQNQPAPDIIITETKKGAIDSDGALYNATTPSAVGTANQLTVTLPRGIAFASVPTIEVAEGNIELNKASLNDDKNVLTIPVASTSTKPSTIKITDVKLTLDRTVPEGAFNANIGGGSIVKNHNPNATIRDKVVFDKGHVVKFHFADVITPAPGEIRATTTFTIGSTDYTVVEAGVAVEKTMDVAPYIKDGRTFLPLRYVANALGVDDDNIIWDPVTKAVTIFKGDRIAQVTIGSKTMLVNGVTINMDVAPEITDDRTMLPIRWMSQALGANIDWDAEARTVTVTQ